MAYEYITKHDSPAFTPAAECRKVFGHDRKITSITIHHWGKDGQSFDGPISWLTRKDANTSAHYIVEAGKVACIVDPDDAAWHAGSAKGNATSIGIECRPEARDGDYETVAELVRTLRATYGDLPLIPHKAWKATTCPGRWDLARLDRLARGTAAPAKPAAAPAKPAAAPAKAAAFTHVIVDGPLIGHVSSDTTKPVFTGQRESFAVGLQLAATGRTYKDSKGATWIQARTPWQVSTGRGGAGLWFAARYVRPLAKVRAGIAGILDAYVASTVGKRVDVDGFPARQPYQCVDISKDWAISRFGARAQAYGNGKDVARGLVDSGQGWTWVAPTEKGQPGDVVSWGAPYGVATETRGGKKVQVEYGHTALLIEDLGSKLKVLQQNGFSAGPAHVATLDKRGLRGYARPPRPATVGATQGTVHTVVAGDTLWGIARRYGVSVAVIQSLNPAAAKDPHNLKVGARLTVSKGA
ncbi:N-acetylmuramoyl-L-alanine amidase [Micrococcus antarcticus]|uniref:N-acetylmuramoyl-L-alanine amidase n=1 Tax=Micrococcus antarcticus TaxID=86171 RepID=UPI00384B7D3C